MAHYSPESRDEALHKVEAAALADERICGLVVVGSGANGFRDELSDLDLAVAVNEDEDVLAVFQSWEDIVRQQLPVLWRFTSTRASRVGLYGFILKDYLEVDISFQPVSLLSARSPNWHVLFDRTGTLEKRLRESWKHRPVPDTVQQYTTILDSIWHYITHGANAVKRGEPWRALHYLQQVRDRAIELEGLHSGCNTHLFREVHKIPAERLIPLEKTLPSSLSADELMRALRVATDRFFDAAALLDSDYGEELSVALRQAMTDYVTT